MPGSYLKSYISRNVIFNEQSFPFASKTHSSNPPTSISQKTSSIQAIKAIIPSKPRDSLTHIQSPTNLPTSTNAYPSFISNPNANSPFTSTASTPLLPGQPVTKLNVQTNTMACKRQQKSPPLSKRLSNMSIGRLPWEMNN